MKSQKRVLNIFLQLLNGQILTKQELIKTYEKDAITIQRDIAIIDETLKEYADKTYLRGEATGTLSQEEYVSQNSVLRSGKGHYQIANFGITPSASNHPLSDEELLIIIKIILASRTLENEEMMMLCDKLIHLGHQQGLLKKLVGNEKLYYQGIPKTSQFDKIELICRCILNSNQIEFDYTKRGQSSRLTRIPQAIYFSDMYIYMLTAGQTAQDDDDLEHLSKFRITNLNNIKIISTNNKLEYATRFEGGLLRKQTDLPFLGNPITMVVDFYWDPIYVLDRFPDSKIIAENDGVYRIEMQVNDGYGMKMWLLSQGDMVKVISPQHMKDYIINDMRDALRYYGLKVSKDDGAGEK